ncbi:MAG: hypothetical protein CM15mP18_2070 [Methanobacteriota archaeon]|nr:MAG: hypothetical protein CM15mP18_2070 [Euryarchaeota archaeon]
MNPRERGPTLRAPRRRDPGGPIGDRMVAMMNPGRAAIPRPWGGPLPGGHGRGGPFRPGNESGVAGFSARRAKTQIFTKLPIPTTWPIPGGPTSRPLGGAGPALAIITSACTGRRFWAKKRGCTGKIHKHGRSRRSWAEDAGGDLPGWSARAIFLGHFPASPTIPAPGVTRRHPRSSASSFDQSREQGLGFSRRSRHRHRGVGRPDRFGVEGPFGITPGVFTPSPAITPGGTSPP